MLKTVECIDVWVYISICIGPGFGGIGPGFGGGMCWTAGVTVRGIHVPYVLYRSVLQCSEAQNGPVHV